MDSKKTCEYTSASAEASEQLAEMIGRRLKGGEVIELISDLGGGKTTFVRGLARGMGSADRVSSPSFTISRVYATDTQELHHFDFYRLKDAGLMEFEISDIIGDPGIVTVIEWGEVVRHILPEGRLTLEIENSGDSNRRFLFHYTDTLKYLMEDIC